MTSALAETAPVVTSGLTKQFRRQIAVDRIDLEVPGGAVYGFLGPNGSGKTTTIRMLLGLISPTAGAISLLGTPMPAAARSVLRRVGSLVEGPAFHPYLSGRANLARLDAADRFSDPARHACGSIAPSIEWACWQLQRSAIGHTRSVCASDWLSQTRC